MQFLEVIMEERLKDFNVRNEPWRRHEWEGKWVDVLLHRLFHEHILPFLLVVVVGTLLLSITAVGTLGVAISFCVCVFSLCELLTYHCGYLYGA